MATPGVGDAKQPDDADDDAKQPDDDADDDAKQTDGVGDDSTMYDCQMVDYFGLLWGMADSQVADDYDPEKE